MDKIEFGDFYRFVVSLGIVLVALGLLLAWLFLRESFDALVTVADMAKLTDCGQLLIRYRHATSLWVIQNLWWISPAVILVGLFVLGRGIYLWSQKQKVIDEKESLENELLRSKVRPMSPEQVAERTVKDAVEDAESEDEEGQEGPGTVPPRVAPPRLAMHRYFLVEKIAIDKLRMCFGEAKVLAHQRIGESEYDAIVTGDSTRKDLVFEFKLVTRPASLRPLVAS